MHNDVPVHSIGELVALARSQPGELTFGSGGIGSSNHLAGALFKSMASIDIQHVPYRGVAQAIPDLLGGRLTLMLSDAPNVQPLVREGKLRALAATSSKRSVGTPELPTMSEAGFAGFDVTVWLGLFAPRGTAASIIAKLYDDFKSRCASKCPRPARRGCN